MVVAEVGLGKPFDVGETIVNAWGEYNGMRMCPIKGYHNDLKLSLLLKWCTGQGQGGDEQWQLIYVQ